MRFVNIKDTKLDLNKICFYKKTIEHTYVSNAKLIDGVYSHTINTFTLTIYFSDSCRHRITSFDEKEIDDIIKQLDDALLVVPLENLHYNGSI